MRLPRADLRSITEREAEVEKVKIDRINELGRLSRERELTEAEREEQAALRQEYLAEVRRALHGEDKK